MALSYRYSMIGRFKGGRIIWGDDTAAGLIARNEFYGEQSDGDGLKMFVGFMENVGRMMVR